MALSFALWLLPFHETHAAPQAIDTLPQSTDSDSDSGHTAREANDEPVAHALASTTQPTAPRTDSLGAAVDVSPDGLHVTASDGRFELHLTPFVQLGYRHVTSDFNDSNNSGFVLKNFCPILTGTYTEFLSYNFVLAVTASDVFVYNAFTTFHAHPVLDIRVGLQAPIFGIAFRQAEYDLMFIRRSMAATIGPERDIGIALDVRPTNALQLEVGAYSGAPDGAVFSFHQATSVAGNAGVRWYARGHDRPTGDQHGFLTLGAAALVRRTTGASGAPHLTPRQSAGGHTYANYATGTFANGRKVGSTVFAHGGYKGLYFQGDFTTSNQEVSDGTTRGRIVEHAWQASASYTIGGVTGWNGTTPFRTVLDGGLGALQIKGRGHGLAAKSRDGDFLENTGGRDRHLSAIGVSAGLSWHLSAGLRVQADYNWTTFGASTTALEKTHEHHLFVGVSAGY